MDRPVSLHQPARVEVGAGTGRAAGRWAGRGRTLVVTGTRTAGLVDRLGIEGEVAVHSGVPPEPDVPAPEAALAAARAVRPDAVIGLGGGSVLDVAKLVAALWDGDQAIGDVAGPDKVRGRTVRLAQVPTTAGTGSEAGIRALVTDPETLSKIAVESPYLIADLAVLDPELTAGVPPDATAATGIDALAHCVEAFTSRRAHDLVDGYARMGLALIGRFLARAVADGADTEARAGMMLASYYGGVCLGPVNTAAGHALAYPLGTRLGLPHGLANAIVFPHVLAFNEPKRPAKTAEVAAALGLSGPLLDAAHRFCSDLGVEMRLSAHGARDGDLDVWAREAHGIRRLMDHNPREMSPGEVAAIYRAAL